MTFEQWWFSKDRPHNGMMSAALAREAWQAAQKAERERAEELVHELKNVLNFVDHWEPSFIIDDPDWPVTQEKAIDAIAKYEESQ